MPAFEVVNEEASAPFLLVCDHASAHLPIDYHHLGLAPEIFETHIAYDLGAAALTRAIAQKLGCTAILAGFSRLLIDPNRGLDDPTLIMQISDGHIIPGNYPLADSERQRRIQAYYVPYHHMITTRLDEMVVAGQVPIILSIHSFTPIFHGKQRVMEAAVLWDSDPRLPSYMRDFMVREKIKNFADNRPYSGRLKGDCMYQHGTMRGFPHALIEIRQDICTDTIQQEIWCKRLTNMLTDSIRDNRMREIKFFPSNAK